MKINIYILFMLNLWLFSACRSTRAVQKDTYHLKNGESYTGSIIQRDSQQFVLVQRNLNTKKIQWTDVDSVSGYKLRTGVLSVSAGAYKTPYFSVFRDEAYSPVSSGFELQWGAARYRKTYRYLTLAWMPARPFSVRKISMGYQYYFRGGYTGGTGLYGGIKGGFLRPEYNNLGHLFVEPYGGGEWRLGGQGRMFAEAGIMGNVFARNRQPGWNISIGTRFHFRNLDKKYKRLNQKFPL